MKNDSTLKEYLCIFAFIFILAVLLFFALGEGLEKQAKIDCERAYKICERYGGEACNPREFEICDVVNGL